MRDADEFIELAACSTGSQGLLSQTDAIGDGVGHATAIKGRTGVECDDVAGRAGLIIQDAQQHVTRLLAVLDTKLAVGGHGETEVLGVDAVFADLTITQLTHQGSAPSEISSMPSMP